MIRIRRRIIAILGLLTVCLTAQRCKIDHGLEPVTSKIGGTIHFVGDVPPKTDEVRVAVIKQFPPKDINELLFSDIILSNRDRQPIEPKPWEVYLSPGGYEIAAVIWKANNESWNISDVIGIYGGTFIGDQLIPPFPFKPIVLSRSSSIIDTINIEANLNRVNRDAAIEGSITFQGSWPSNTGIVGIGAFTDIPQKGNLLDYLFKNVALDYSISTYVDHAEYRLRVRSTDVLKYIAVLWIDGSYSLASLREIGYYRDPSDPTKPGTVAMSAGTIPNLNIDVNFNGQGGAP